MKQALSALGPYFESWPHDSLVKFSKDAYAKLQKAPPQRQPLTEKEIEALARYEDKHGQGPWHLAFARAIERAHGIGGGE